MIEQRSRRRIKTDKCYAELIAGCHISIVPGEHTSDDNKTRLGITKAGNRHLRLSLTEEVQHYGRGQVGFKSKTLKTRQAGNASEAICYAYRCFFGW